MDLVTGAMGNLAPKLLQLLRDEYKLQKGVKKQVEFVSYELKSICVALQKVGEVPLDQLDPQVRLWACEVREASYDMEDVLDTFLVRVEGDGKPTGDQGRLKRAMKKMGDLFSKAKARHEISSIIEDIKKQLDEVAERRAKYKIDAIVQKPEGETSIDPRLSALYTEASKLVGIDEPKEALIKMLSIGKDDDTSSKDKIVSVVGSGGLGKTTLARVAYDEVTLQFDCCAFVPVGQNRFPEKKFLKNVLVGLINDETKKTNVGDEKRYTGADLTELEPCDLIKQIREYLEGKRYLIVVDDIWDRGTWESIKLAFVESNCGSRIVTTSRNSLVSEEIGDEVYRINKLSDQNSRKLFCARISDKKGDKCPDIDNLDEVSDKIIKKCDGVPLIIIAVASMLATKPRNEWSDVYKSIGFWHDGDNIEASNMKKILSFSYYDLPCEIRTCMLYLSVYPEDYYVDKNMLILKWIAEGLVPTKEGGKGLFEVGEGYFHELVNRGLILPSDDGGIVDGCHFHDFVLDLIRELSREQNFVTTVTGSQQQQSFSLPGSGKVRRLALQNKSETIIKVDEKQMEVARSFNAMYSSMLDHISVAGFKHLRVLSLEYCRLEEGYLEEIGKLYYLRYLGLSGTKVGKLPEGVGNLKFLQTLILDGTGIKELPESLEHRTELMCLRADKTTVVPDWIGKLTSLVELEVYIGASSARQFVKELGQLTRLRVLKTEIDLQHQRQPIDLLQSLMKLREIEIVEVEFLSDTISLARQRDRLFDVSKSNNLRVLILNALQFPRLPAWINSGALPKLCRLKLDLSKFQQQHMDILGRFPNLRSLELWLATGSCLKYGDIIIYGEGGFQNLERFKITGWYSTMVKFVPGAMPRLRNLRFGIDHALDWDDKLVLDYGLENLRSLELADATILCLDCFPAEIEAVEAAVKRQVLEIRPNRPPKLSVKVEKGATVDKRSALLARCLRVWEQLRKQARLFITLTLDWIRKGPRGASSVNKLTRIREECMDALETALDGRILRRGGVNDPETWKQFRAQLHAQEEDKILGLILHDQYDVHEVMEYIAAQERGLAVLSTTKYQRLAAMREEVKALHSLEDWEEVIKYRLNRQIKLHRGLDINFETTELLPIDGIKLQVQKFMDQWYDTTDLAFHGRILRPSELGAEDHRDYHQEIVEFWERYNAKYTYLTNFEEDRDINQVRANMAALKGALDILTAEYPRLASMWEELQAAQDGLLPAVVREEELRKRLDEALLRYRPLISPSGLDKLLAIDANKVYRYMYQTWDRVELAMHGRILWRSEIGDEYHLDYMNQGMDRVLDQLSVASLKPFGQDRDVHQVTENIAAKEAVLKKLIVEYPRLATMFEELKAELCLPAAEDVGADTIANNVTEETEEP